MPLKFQRPGTKDLQDPAWWERLFRAMQVSPDNDSVTTEKIADEAVTNAKFRDSAGYSVIGRTASSAGSPADIAAGTERHVLVRRAGGLIFDAIQDADIPATIARDSEVSSAQAAAEATAAAALAAHVVAADPHPTYTTAAELAAAIAAHTSSADNVTDADLTSALSSYATAASVTAVSDKLPTTGGNYADDTAAAVGGIAIGSMYHTAGAVKIRLA
jgi:hypothetical protein